MSVDYEDNNKFKALASILEDYTEWFGAIALYTGYSGEENVPQDFSMPASFTDWLENSDIHAEISSAVLQPIIDIHNALRDISNDLTTSLKRDQKPKHQEFVEFKNLYSSFLSSIRRLEKDSALKSDGTDELTGLRPSSAVKHDLDKEMQRLSRNGNPFTLMLARLDMFEDYDNQQEAVSIAVESIKRSMRPFDDAYYLDNGHFLLSLKHADLVGAEVAITRIQQSLKVDENNTRNVTLSCCMSEPVSGDKIPDLLKNMQDDLDSHTEERGAILKLLDISPLERFVDSNR